MLRLVVLAISVFAFTPAARAQALAWSGPAECIDAQAFEAAFADALSVPLSEHAAGTAITVTFAALDGFTVTVDVEADGVRRTRALSTHGASCHALDDGLIVVVALLVEDVGAEVTRLHAPIEIPPPPPSRPSLRGAVAAGASVRVDALPGLSVGPTLAGEVRPVDVVTLGLEATYFVPLSTRRSDGVGAEASAVGGGLYGCVLAPLAPSSQVGFELGGCAHLAGWAVTASGQGLSDAETSVGFGLDMALAARAGIELASPLWLRAEVGLGLSLVRPRIDYEIGGVPATYHLASIAFPMASLFFEVRMGEP